MRKKLIMLTMIAMVLLVGCGKNELLPVVNEGGNDSQDTTAAVVEEIEDVSEEILDTISEGNAKVRNAINTISYGSGDTYEDLYDDACKGLESIEESTKSYADVIELCGDNADYATLKKRLEKVIDSVPSKTTSATESGMNDFTEWYSQFITAMANLEAEAKNISKEVGYLYTSALK